MDSQATITTAAKSQSDRIQDQFRSARNASIRQFVMISVLAGAAAAVMTLGCSGPGMSPLVSVLQLH